MMNFELGYSDDGITLTLRQEKTGLLSRLRGQGSAHDLDHLKPEDRALVLALGDLRALGDEHPGELEIGHDSIHMSHTVAAACDNATAAAIGLPPPVNYFLETDVEGIVGSPSFKLSYRWLEHGRRQIPRRVGAILETSRGLRRIPLWMKSAIEVADGFGGSGRETDHWTALANYRQALDPGVSVGDESYAARVSMTDFLKGLRVQLADQFSISPQETPQGLDFNVVPFSRKNLTAAGHEGDDGEIREEESELGAELLASFQGKFRERGVLPAYRVADGAYLVIDRSSTPVLEVMAEMQRAPAETRDAFVRNPRPAITEKIEEQLRKSGKLEGLNDAQQQELIENQAGPSFIETREYSERVLGIAPWRKPDLDLGPGSGTTWMPEVFGEAVSAALSQMPIEEIEALRKELAQAVEDGRPSVEVAGQEVPANDSTLAGINARIEALREEEPPPPPEEEEDDEAKPGPIVLETADNFEALAWRPECGPRQATIPMAVPEKIRTSLKNHQKESFSWAVKAWEAGLPGVLNADEQGLGKTLQTISFLAWLKAHMEAETAEHRGPVLVVAPTSLLENWEEEVARHVDAPGLGHLIRLYGSALSARRRIGTRGIDTESGEDKLDLDTIHEAVAEGRAHRFWMLTTYTTLTNYQHSLGKIPFSAVVFDEIQAIKNPASLRANAARAIDADFRIGLTGTPIENATIDLWAIMDELAPGALGTLRGFRKRYQTPNEGNMEELYRLVFREQNGYPPLAIRRLKETVARDLPAKSRKLHPRVMPEPQSTAYEEARIKLAEQKPGAALKMLHHIRTVSVHPHVQAAVGNADFIDSSGRLAATFEILHEIERRGERALVFIEHRQMQYRFTELVRQEFGLNRVDVINGDTPIPKRQAIVNHFQRHLKEDGGFDLLVLGPKAAGTGLTLTAATHVIHLSRWWNPAVEEQCNDRVHRIGQAKPVTVHVPMAIHPRYREQSFDCLLHSLMQRKRHLASSALWPMGDTRDDAAELQKTLSSEGTSGSGDPVKAAVAAMFERDGAGAPEFDRDGAVAFS